MKKSKKIIAAASAVLILMALAPISVLAKDIAEKKFVLDDNQQIEYSLNEMDTGSIQSRSVEEPLSSEAVAAKIDRSRVLEALSLNSSNMQSFDTAEYYNSDIKYEAKFDDGSVISFDKNMNVIVYSNFDRKSENSQTSNDALINVLKQEYNIDETYHLDVSYEANENGKDDIKYYWSKTEKSGVQNLYDALSVRIDGSTNEIVIFNRFNDVAEVSEIKITEAEAQRIALNLREEFSKVTSCKKVYVKPSDLWNEEENQDEKDAAVRLAYNVCINKMYFVYTNIIFKPYCSIFFILILFFIP